MSRILSGAAALWFVLPTTVEAQIVRFGPFGGVSVRAPFVSVDVGPWGGTRVRAPFTSVDTLGHSYLAPDGYPYAPHLPGPVPPDRDFHSPYFRGYHRDYSRDHYPLPHQELPHHGGQPFDGDGEGLLTPESSYRPILPEIHRPPAPRFHIPSYSEVFPDSVDPATELENWQTAGDPTRLATRLKEGAERLQQTLGVREDRDVWIDYLACEEIRELADAMIAERSLAGVSVSQARGMLASFDGVEANSSLAWVTRLSGFDDTRGALIDLVAVLDAEPTAEFDAEPRELESRRMDDDDLVPLPESEELPPPAPDADAVPQPVFRGEV